MQVVRLLVAAVLAFPILAVPSVVLADGRAAVEHETAAGARAEALRECGAGCSAAQALPSAGWPRVAVTQDAPPPSAPSAGTAAQENLFWQSIMNSEDPADYQAYLEQFPEGVFARLARNRLAALGASMTDRQAMEPGRVFRDCSFCPELVVVPAGRFRMGCVSGSRECEDDEFPVHEVQVKAFALGRYEVTFSEYDRFTDATGRRRADDEGWGRDRRPVINVSWDDAVSYTYWLSEETGESYRLPSEAEWEYAARAGTTTAYGWGADRGRDRANCRRCGSRWDNDETAPVGSFPANRWGFHDVHGNVYEWTSDCWHESYRGAPTDGSTWTRGGYCERRVLRSGSWAHNPTGMRSANRVGTDGRGRNVRGFRVARSLD